MELPRQLISILILMGTLNVAGCASSKYQDEELSWRRLCTYVLGEPTLVLGEEFANQDSLSRDLLVDGYLLSAPSDEFPSAIRERLVDSREAIRQFRAGKLDAEVARGLAAPGFEAIESEAFDGACDEYRSAPS